MAGEREKFRKIFVVVSFRFFLPEFASLGAGRFFVAMGRVGEGKRGKFMGDEAIGTDIGEAAVCSGVFEVL